MTSLKTRPRDADVPAFVEAITPQQRRLDAQRLLVIFRETTGFAPVLWGRDMIGFGAYEYSTASGRSGRWFATGFAARRSGMSVYILPGYQDYGALLAKLGPHKKGKSCLVFKRLDDIDRSTLADLVRTGLHDLDRIWTVLPA
ncbi:MAG: DUF1801 domain-containing protein [Pseudomonadota bacterium]